MDEAKQQRPNIGSRVTREGHARFWERPEVKFLRATRHSLDDLVGAGEDRWRDRQSEFPRCFQIDDQFERRRLLDRQIGWVGAIENLSGISAQLVPYARKARSIADQPPIAVNSGFG